MLARWRATHEDRTLLKQRVRELEAQVEAQAKPKLTDDDWFGVACGLRDWIHTQPWSECGPGADTCPDWPKAFEIRNLVKNTLERRGRL